MYVRNNEPSVDELLSDEVARLVMARDGLSDDAVRALFREVGRRLEARGRRPAELAAEAVA